MVEIFCLAQEPKRITCGYPVCTVVFRVTVTCKSFITAIEVNIHFFNEILINKIIGIENYVSIAIVFFGKKFLK